MSEIKLQNRNKFNTLTLAEARKLNKSMVQMSKRPIRTASVMNKPRPPPLIVTNLDSCDNQLCDKNSAKQQELPFERTNSIRSESVGPCAGGSRRDRRHSINFGAIRASTLNSRLSLYSNSSGSHLKPLYHTTSINDSISNLSFKSSRDTPDCANQPNQSRLQTMSVDLGSASELSPSDERSLYGARSLRLGKSYTIARTSASTVEPFCILDKYKKNAPLKLSDDSYVSAKSDLSDQQAAAGGWMLHSGYGTPQRQYSNLSNNSKRSGSSKSSLTSSTYKVLQNPFANFKRLFRSGSTSKQCDKENDKNDANISSECSNNNDNTLTNESFKSSLGYDMSAAAEALNRSQTPPVCPPPPGELKSMSYMNRKNQEYLHMRQRCFNASTTVLPRPPVQPPPPPPLQQSALYTDRGDEQQQDFWQLTSLPVYYERNLATVFEEQKQQQNCAAAKKERFSQHQSFVDTDQQQSSFATYANSNHQVADPPSRFDDRADQQSLIHTNSIGSALTSSHTRSRTGSCRSLASTTTTDSVLDFQRQQQPPPPPTPATPFRFSFAQPLSPPAPLNVPNIDKINQNGNTGLPPRVPPSSATSCSTFTDNSLNGARDSTRSRHGGGEMITTRQLLSSDNNSSSGNSSNCSSQLNVINNCDRLSSLEISERTSSYSDESTNQTNGNNGPSDIMMGFTGRNLNGLENDLDTTIISETSTLQGDTSTAAGRGSAAFYMNKCAELERTIVALKNKLIGKEKELTELQLSQLNYDFTIDKLRSQVSKLEKDNQQLRRRQLL